MFAVSPQAFAEFCNQTTPAKAAQTEAEVDLRYPSLKELANDKLKEGLADLKEGKSVWVIPIEVRHPDSREVIEALANRLHAELEAAGFKVRIHPGFARTQPLGEPLPVRVQVLLN